VKKILTIIALLAIGSTSLAVDCVATRVQTGKPPANIALKANAIFGKNNPGKTLLNEAAPTFPYGLSITTSSSSQDVTVIIRQKTNLFSSSGASGALDSQGKFEQTIILNSPSSIQDIIDVVCQ
jgi:hypothetical protein